MSPAAFDELFDFVVVGSGGGSMCASLVMRSQGKTAVVLEKTQLVGGTTAQSGGVLWIPNNRFMKRDGVADSLENAAAYLDSLVGNADDAPGASRARRQTFLREAPRMIDFLVVQGIKLDRIAYWPDYYDEKPGGSVRGRTVVAELFDLNELGPWKERLRPGFVPVAARLDEAMLLRTFKSSWTGKRLVLKLGWRTVLSRLLGKRMVTAGAALQGRMLKAALDAGVDIRSASPVQELIVENGAVTGVLTLRDGRPWRIGARLGVLVNAGGFARNQQMRDRYQPGTRAEWSSAAEGDTGEMILKMIAQGAAVAQMDEMIGNQATMTPGAETAIIKPGVQSMTAAPHCILVDQSGVRYMTEGGSYMAYCKGMLERNRTVPAVPSWAIFDSQFLRKYTPAGVAPGGRPPAAWYDEGYLRKADTIEGLARVIDVAPAVLAATIERFNGFVANNRDEDFQRGERAYDRWLGDPHHKPNETLGSICEGPFYAVQVVPGDVSTFGGVVTDANARVLREDGSAIPGLYATGACTASVMGRAYPGAGSSLGPTFTWAFVAARHALKQNGAARGADGALGGVRAGGRRARPRKKASQQH